MDYSAKRWRDTLPKFQKYLLDGYGQSFLLSVGKKRDYSGTKWPFK